jgi:hypothetical protein
MLYANNSVIGWPTFGPKRGPGLIGQLGGSLRRVPERQNNHNTTKGYRGIENAPSN